MIPNTKFFLSNVIPNSDYVFRSLLFRKSSAWDKQLPSPGILNTKILLESPGLVYERFYLAVV